MRNLEATWTDGSTPLVNKAACLPGGRPMIKHLIVTLFALANVITWSVESKADETGIAMIHSWAKIGRKTCFSDHYHYGSGRGSTQRQARVEAIKSWIWPTSLEYGSSWADYRLAVGKEMKCARNGAVWNCDLQARPCRGN